MPVRGTARPIEKLADWDYATDYIQRMLAPGEDNLDVLKFMAELQPQYLQLMARRGRLQELGLSFQEMLYAMAVVRQGAQTIVETGVRTGVSTRLLLMAVHERGCVYSCDSDKTTPDQDKALNKILAALDQYPMPDAAGRWFFKGQRSVDCLLGIAQETGGWDIFLADSDHKLENQTFELEFGWAMLKQGGLLVCNRWNFPEPDGPRHGAFETFCKRRDLEWNTIGTAAVVEKGDTDGYEALPIKAEPSRLYQAAIAVAVADQRAFSSAAPPSLECYLER